VWTLMEATRSPFLLQAHEKHLGERR